MAGESKPAEIKALSGARAIPPLILVMFHFCEGHGYRGFRWFDMLAAKGYLWVEFFFALSGFILFHVYASRDREFWEGRAYIPFLRARLIRLYPLHLFMLFVILALVVVLRALAAEGGYTSIYDLPYHPIVTVPSFIANLFLVQAWNILPGLTWNGVAWFVSVEFALCLLFPLYLVAARGGGLWRGVLIVAAGIAGLTTLCLTSKHGLDITFHNGILRGMSAFAVGVGFSLIYNAAKEGSRAPLPAWVHTLAQLAMLGALFYAIYYTGWSHTHRDILTVLPMMGLVYLLAFDRGAIASFLKTRVPMKLGEWSYAIYIGQTAWLQLIRFVEQRLYPPQDTMVFGWRWADFIWWLEPAGLLLVCVAWGALLAVAIEHPASEALKRLFSRQSQRGAVSA
jgi:peptidoglycan/LPS O-acetylase OafA/YrhL